MLNCSLCYVLHNMYLFKSDSGEAGLTDIPRIWFCISDSKIRGMFWVEQVTAAILGVSNASQEGISADERN